MDHTEIVEELRHTPEFKALVEKKAPNVLLFERIIKKISKICQNHPEEVLKFNDDVWSKILQTLF